MRILTMCALALALHVCASAASYEHTTEKTFTLSSGPGRMLVLENIHGNIRVSGTSGNEIRVKAHEEWTADREEDLRRGREDVRLEMTQTGNEVRVSLEGPFRNPNRERWWERQPRYEYHFRHDYDVTAPRDVVLNLRTVNGRDLTIENTTGEFNLRNVNGAITATGVSGSGTIKTVNGQVKVVYTKNPTAACSFETLNGEVDVTFQPDLNADLLLSSFHGEAYTDFDVQPMTMPVSVESSKGGHRFRLDRDRGVRVGSGGLQHRFKTFNGSIKIRKNGK